MNIETFLTCLGYYGVATGASANLEGVYAPNSGTTGYLFNQLYAPALHSTGGIIYSPVIPLINVGRQPLSGNNFTMQQALRAGYQHSGNFGVFMEIEYSGCLRSDYLKGNVLLSTSDNPQSLDTGFFIGINDRNRLFFKTRDKGYTLTEELSTHDIVYVALTESQYVTFGMFKVDENKFYSKDVALDSGNFSTNAIYFGGMLNYSGGGDFYTGYSGKMNQIVLLNDGLSNLDVGPCSLCSLATGYSVVPLVTNFTGQQITGYYFSGITTIGNTGYALLTGQVQRADGSFVSVLYQSGISGYIASGDVVTPLLGNVNLQTTGYAYTFFNDQNTINSFTRRSLEFDIPLSSGDVVEIYTYPAFNSQVNLPISGDTWPTQTGFTQMYGNGLAETSGIDFYVNHQTISGFNSEDILIYDVLRSGSVVTAYSGYWLANRTLMSGGSYFPPAAQYYEGTGFTGQVKITGLNLVSTANPFYPNFGYDLYMNGQKLVSGLQFNVVTSGTGFVVSLSGDNLPQLNPNLLYHPTGGLPTGVNGYDDNELAFIPQFSGFQRTRYDATNIIANIGNITGFSPQIWVNGVRQHREIDYFLHDSCDALSSLPDYPHTPFTYYKSDTDSVNLWNFPLMPYFEIIDTDVSSDGPSGVITLTTYNMNVYNSVYNTSGFQWGEVELRSNLGTFRNTFALGDDANVTIYTGASVSLTGNIYLRYHKDNVIGAWSTPSNQIVHSFN